MTKVIREMPAYTYGETTVGTSSVSLEELEQLKVSAGFKADDERYLRRAGEVLESQARRIVAHWRSGIIASIPNLARHSRSPAGEPIPNYLAQSNLRFEQWILDTCLRPYDQDWLNYQQEIALRHTSLKKNQADGVESTAYVPFRDIAAFVAVMNETIKPYLANSGNSAEEVDAMHGAWCMVPLSPTADRTLVAPLHGSRQDEERVVNHPARRNSLLAIIVGILACIKTKLVTN